MDNWEFISVTAKTYIENPEKRALLDNLKCTYKTPDGRCCALGMWMTPNELRRKAVKENMCIEDLGFTISKLVNVPLELQQDMQCWHDCIEFWDRKENCITSLGREKLERIIEQFAPYHNIKEIYQEEEK